MNIQMKQKVQIYHRYDDSKKEKIGTKNFRPNYNWMDGKKREKK